jgi:hypothetical protein
VIAFIARERGLEFCVCVTLHLMDERTIYAEGEAENATLVAGEAGNQSKAGRQQSVPPEGEPSLAAAAQVGAVAQLNS